MGGAIDPNAIPLPSGWFVFAKGCLLRAVGLAHYALTHVRSWCADSPIARLRLKGRVELLEAEVALLKEELRGFRPHRSIGGATPLEVCRGARPANESRRVEPANGICAKPQSAARAGKRPRNLELVVSGLHGAPASLLPIITLRDAA